MNQKGIRQGAQNIGTEIHAQDHISQFWNLVFVLGEGRGGEVKWPVTWLGSHRSSELENWPGHLNSLSFLSWDPTDHVLQRLTVFHHFLSDFKSFSWSTPLPLFWTFVTEWMTPQMAPFMIHNQNPLSWAENPLMVRNWSTTYVVTNKSWKWASFDQLVKNCILDKDNIHYILLSIIWFHEGKSLIVL